MTSTEQTPVVQKIAVQQPTHPSWYIPPVSPGPSSGQTPARQQQNPIVECAIKKRSVFEWVAICFGGFFLLAVIAVIIVASNMPTGSVSNDTIISQDLSSIALSINDLPTASVYNDTIISQDLSSIALSINDLPTGWKTWGQAANTIDTHSSKFIKVEVLTTYVVYLEITRYPTVDQAKTEYLSKKEKNAQFKVESVNIGNDGFGYINDDSSIVKFRQGNIIVETQYREWASIDESSDLSINDAKEYAKIIANRIK